MPSEVNFYQNKSVSCNLILHKKELTLTTASHHVLMSSISPPPLMQTKAIPDSLSPSCGSGSITASSVSLGDSGCRFEEENDASCR